MKKSLIALAVAGAFAAPSAMAVEFVPTLYQSVALSFGSSDLGGVPVSGPGGLSQGDTNSLRTGGGSTIGFKFTDDLGNGMTAEAFVHFTTNITKGSNATVVHRNGYVGLTGNFGAVKLGTNEHVYEVGQIIDGWGADWQGGNSVGFWTGSPTRIGLSGWNFTRQDTKSLWWTSPSWGGFILDAAWIGGPDNNGGTVNKDAEGAQLAAKWSNSAFMVSGAWADYSDYSQQSGAFGGGQNGGAFFGETSCTGANDCIDATGIRFTFVWTAGWGNLGITTNIMESELQTAVPVKTEVTTYSLTGTFNVASGRVILNYVSADDQEINGVSINSSGAEGFDIGYQHDLSASSYVFARWESNEGDANYTTSGQKIESDALMLGLKVSY